MNISQKLNDSELPKEEEEAIIGAFVRRQKREALRERWSQKLAVDLNVQRSIVPTGIKEKTRIRRLMIWGVSVAAAVLLVLTLVLPGLTASSRDEVVAELIMSTEIQTLRGEAPEAYAVLRADFGRQYNAGDYAAAVTTGQQLVAYPDARPQDNLNLGLAYLNTERLQEAEAIFQDFLENQPDYQTEARFYLALTLLERDREAAALELLEGIQPSDGDAWYRKAQRVLSADR